MTKIAPKKRIAKDASRRIDEKIVALGDWRGERLVELRKLIHQVDPEVVEEWKWMGSPTWSHDGIYAVANAHKDKVKLTFAHGAALRDPKKLFNATLGGGTWRAIDFRERDRINRTALGALLREAVVYNTSHSAAKSQGSRGARKPILLAGGNPQIAKGEGDAPVQAYLAAMPGWKRDVGRRLDALIVRTVPRVRKAVKWNSPFYGVEGEGWFLAFHCFTKYVKLTFFRGTSLRPPPPVESKDPKTRSFHIHEDDQLDEKRLVRWIRQASKLPGWIP
jgi:hypothetical protein